MNDKNLEQDQTPDQLTEVNPNTHGQILRTIQTFLRKYYFAPFLMLMGIHGVLLNEFREKKIDQDRKAQLAFIPVDMAHYKEEIANIRNILKENPESAEQLLRDHPQEPHLQLAVIDSIDQFDPEWFKHLFEESVQIQAILKMSYPHKLAPRTIKTLMSQAAFDTVRAFLKEWIMVKKTDDWIADVIDNLDKSPSKHITQAEVLDSSH